ncbi:MAG: hypothetical protein JNL08_00550 [Planctomycetes bacterium]|nr:hypothetical protein [Planctomycetota bacterium]
MLGALLWFGLMVAPRPQTPPAPAPAPAPAPKAPAPAPAATDAVATAVRQFVDACADATAPSDLVARAAAVHDAAPDLPVRAALRTLGELLAGANTWDGFASGSAEQLLALVQQHRGGPHPELVAPLLLVLERQQPARPEVHLGLAEVFGAATAVRDVARAIAALDRVQQLLPSQDDGTPETLARAVGMLRFLGDVADGWRGVNTLWHYLGLLRTSVAGDGSMPMVRAEDVAACRLCEDLAAARRRGRQAESLQLLQKLQALQPANPIYALLRAETHASWGAFDLPQAQQQIDRFLALSEPAALAAAAKQSWCNLAAARWCLRVLDWDPAVPATASSWEDLRDYAQQLRKLVKPDTGSRLAVAADAGELESQLGRMRRDCEQRREKRDKAVALLQQLQDEYDAAAGAEQNPGRRGRGTFDPTPAERRAARADALRALDRQRPVTERLQAECQHALDRLADHERRFAKLRP